VASDPSQAFEGRVWRCIIRPSPRAAVKAACERADKRSVVIAATRDIGGRPPPAGDAATMSRWLAYLLLSGGGFALLALVFLPMPSDADQLGSGLTSAAALVLAAVVFGFRDRLAAWVLPWLVVLSTVMVSLGIAFWGQSPSDDAMFYVWMAVFACYFFSGRQAAVQLAWVAGAYAVVLIWQGAGEAASTRWAVTTITLVVAGTVISGLVRRLRVAVATLAAAAVERERLLEHLATAALTDQLTGLPNRRAWDEQLGRELARARRDGGQVNVAILDLDCFKAYNDRHGHPAGDQLLKAIAHAWRDQLRGGDLLARHGGDEFTVLLPGCDHANASALIDRLRAATPPPCSASAGLAAWNRSESPDQLISRADRALYRAKAHGRNTTAATAQEAVASR